MSSASIDPKAFRDAFARFQALVTANSGHPFRGFDEGLAAAWESYKPRLRDYALGLLRAGEWSEGDVGSGAILNRMIEAIEIQESEVISATTLFWRRVEKLMPIALKAQATAYCWLHEAPVLPDRGFHGPLVNAAAECGADAHATEKGRTNGQRLPANSRGVPHDVPRRHGDQ
jgi:hypothetical protein